MNSACLRYRNEEGQHVRLGFPVPMLDFVFVGGFH